MILSFKEYVEEKYQHPKTVNGYVKDAEDFLLFLKKEGLTAAQVKEMQVKKYQIHLTESGYSTHTIARKISTLRLYFKYLRKSGMMNHNPMEDIKQPVLEKREKKLTEKEVRQIKELIGEKKRDKLLFFLLYEEKIKLSEIVKIENNHYHQTQGILYLEKKALSMKEETKRLIEAIIEEQKEGPLVRSKNGKKLTEPGAYFIIKTYLKQIERNDLRPIDLTK